MHYDVLVLGGGSAGCVVAARLSEDENRTVCLVEAGPDYGAFGDGGWPADLLDPGGLPESHEWDPHEIPQSPFRARVLGGCSAHNACLLVWPPDADPELEPFRQRALDTIAPEPFFFDDDELSPWFAAVAEGCAEHEIEAVTGPFNIRGGVRWNAAFAYLDPVRARSNLTIRGNALVDRVVFEDERATGAIADGQLIEADVIVICAGAIGSPAILLRSGVDREGLGENFQDHVTTKLVFETNDALRNETPMSFASGIAKTPDLHFLPLTDRLGEHAHITIALLQPRSRGRVALRSTDPAVSPQIEHRLLSDPRDREALSEALHFARTVTDTQAVRRFGRPVTSSIEETLGIYFHPVGTCSAIVDEHGRVDGYENLFVIDASIFETIPRANTHLPTLALAEKLGSAL